MTSEKGQAVISSGFPPIPKGEPFGWCWLCDREVHSMARLCVYEPPQRQCQECGHEISVLAPTELCGRCVAKVVIQGVK
jgi:hypothetical protein